jgi:hypothetical protein
VAKYVIRSEGLIEYVEACVVEFDGTQEELQEWLESEKRDDWEESTDDDFKWERIYEDDYGDGATWTVETVEDWKDRELEDGRKVVGLAATKLA